MTRFLDEYQEQIEKFENILNIPAKYDMIVHTTSIILALMIENYTTSKDISYIRATIYYFSIYGYVTAFLINKTVKDVATLLKLLITHAKEKRLERL